MTGGRRRDAVWWAGLVVAVAAAAATSHGLYAVAVASGVPRPVAVLYPVMTDGLALVAYSATNRLTDGPRRYAWSVVIAAAGLSGAAQALYLAGSGVNDAPATVRFGIGAAPAVAAAGVAHLLHLIRTSSERPAAVRSIELAAHLGSRPAAEPGVPDQSTPPVGRRPTVRPGDRSGMPATGATERARRAASRYRDQHGALPTASELVRTAHVSRGTAGTVLRELRTAPPDTPSSPASQDHLAHPQSKIQNDHTPRHHDPEEDQLRPSQATAKPAGGRR